MAGVATLGYPIETVLAEKTVTAVDLGAASTRVRDYADIFSITSAHDLSHDGVRHAIAATARHRGIELAPLTERVGGFAVLRAPRR